MIYLRHFLLEEMLIIFCLRNMTMSKMETRGGVTIIINQIIAQSDQKSGQLFPAIFP